jgi:hypothetical protein
MNLEQIIVNIIDRTSIVFCLEILFLLFF